MEVWKIRLFVRICLLYAAFGLLSEFKDEELICLIEECLAVALFLGDVAIQRLSYILLGPLYQQVHQVGKAVRYYKKCLHFANEIGDINGEFAACQCIGMAYHLQGDFLEATKYHEKCLNIAKEMGNKREESAAYENLGNDYQALGNYHRAIEYHKKSLSIATEIEDREMEGKTHSNLGEAYQSLGKYQEAIECQEKRLAIAIEISDNTEKAGAYEKIGFIYESLGKYLKAIEYHEKSLGIALRIGDREREGVAYGNLGNVYQSIGKHQDAIKYYDKCLGIALERGDKEAEGITYGNLGNTYQLLGRYQEAIEYNEKCLCIALEIGDKTGEVVAYISIGDIYRSSGKCQEAIKYHKKCLHIAIEIGDRNGEAKAYGNLGNDNLSLGKYYEAKDYFEKYLTIAMDIRDRKEQGNAYGCLGTVYYSLAKYQKAIDYHEKSLAIALEINNRAGEEAAFSNLGNAYHAFWKYHEAKQYYEKWLSIALEIGDRKGEGAAYGSIGKIYQVFGNYQKAMEYQEKCLTIAVEVGDRRAEEFGYGNLGNAYQSLGKYYKAIEYQEKCLGIAMEIGDRGKEGEANGYIGAAYQSLEKFQEAIEYHKKNLSIAEEMDDRDGQGKAHFKIGSSYASLAMQQGSDRPTNIKEAERHLKKSIQSLESIFDDLEEDQHKISIVDTFIAAYKLLAHVHVQSQQTQEGLLVSDRGRARALGDLLTAKYSLRKQVTSKGDSIEATDIEMILSTQCNFAILFYAVQADDVAPHIWVLAPQSPIYFHHSEFKGLESNLVKKSYGKMKVREGIKCENRSLEFLKAEDQDIVKELVSSQVPEQNITKLMQIGKEGDKTDARCIYDEYHDDDEKPMEMLYDALVAPVLDKLVKDEIVIIPDGPLNMVPYAAFKDPKTGQFLSETKRIRLVPSLTTLKVLQESSNDHHDKSGALIVGNPEIGKVKFEGIERSFTDLPGAEDEAEEIAKLLGVEPLIGRQATKEAVVQKLQVGVSVIHFAAHGSPENGQILLAPSTSSATNSIPDEQDYILTMNEAQESGIRAQLVVLSCCHSGRGEIKSEGVVGMSRAFLAAGARAVVASLWAIDDNATKVFMLKFYSHLKKGESASRSLQQAMKDMRETERYKEPRYWAAFFLIGDDVTISV